MAMALARVVGSLIRASSASVGSLKRGLLALMVDSWICLASVLMLSSSQRGPLASMADSSKRVNSSESKIHLSQEVLRIDLWRGLYTSPPTISLDIFFVQ